MAKAPKKGQASITTAPAYDKGKMFDFYRASVATIRRDWDAFSHFYLDGKRREYLNREVPTLADCVSTSLTVSIYMGLAQLFDPLMTFNQPSKSNLVLRRVIDDMAPPAGTPERAQIDADFVAMGPTIKLVKDWRNT